MFSSWNYWSHLQELAVRVVHHEHGSWGHFWNRLVPTLEAWARSRRVLGWLHGDEDCRQDIVTRTWEKLRDDDFRRLRRFLARSQETPARVARDDDVRTAHPLQLWTFTVFRNLAHDHIRGMSRFRRTPARDGDDRRWYVHVPLSEEVPSHAGRSQEHILLYQLLDWLQLGDMATSDACPDRDREQRGRLYVDVLCLRMQGYEYDEIASHLGLRDSRHAQRVRNAAMRMLERKCRSCS